MSKYINYIFILLISGLFQLGVVAQDCDPEVPHFDVDLTDQVDGIFFSPAVQRVGNCCGTTQPDQCISFTLTLHEDAVGILFDICDGAVPPGALYYQIDCGPQVQVGNVLCLDGAGPHQLTFCKPGNNQNVYCITSIPKPSPGPAQIASDGCTADIWAIGYDPATINWTSVFPGPVGTYDDQLSCPTCQTTTVTAPEDFPPYTDFMICGQTIGSCATTPDCDTVRVYFEANLAVEIAPEDPAICFGSTGTDVTAVGSGGFPPYTFTWSNGTVGESTWIDEPGTYTVQISDTSGCPPASYEFEVIEYDLPLTVDAGSDITVCTDVSSVTLNGTFSGIDQSFWQGGDGVFTPDRYDPTAMYTPTPEEISGGQIELILTLNPLGGCPPLSDTLLIQFAPFSASITSDVIGVQCFGADNGAINVAAEGSWEPYSISWDDANLLGWSIENLAPGMYSATISNAVGCDFQLEFEIQEPPPLAIEINEVTDITCFGLQNGNASLSVSGGVPEYSYTWPNGESNTEYAENLSPGNYTVVVEDSNQCTDSVEFTIAQPDSVQLDATADTLICVGTAVELTAQAIGGNGNYVYHWSHGLTNSPDQSLTLDEDEVISVYATDQNGCFSDTVFLPVNVIDMNADLLEVVPGDPVCLGGSSHVSAFYNGDHPPYYYNWSHNLPEGPGPHIVSPEETTVYTVTVSDDCGNEVSAEMEVIIWPLPQLTLQDHSDVECFGMNNGTATLAVNGGTPEYEYFWSDGLDHQSVATSLAPGQHIVNVFDLHQCPDSLSFVITEPEPLTITATADTLVCPGEEVLITAEASGGVGNYNFQWSSGPSNEPVHTITPTEDVTVTVSASDDNGCTTEPITIDIDVITMNPDLLSTLGGNPICPGASTTVSANYNGEYPPYFYQWSHNLPDGPGEHSVQPQTTTTYTVLVTDQCDNAVQGDAGVEVLPEPVINIPDLLGNGCADLEVFAVDSINDPANNTHVWTVNGTQVFHGHIFDQTFTEPGVHNIELSVTSFDGCHAASDNPSLVIVLPTPDATFIANPWEAGIDNPEIHFTDLSTGNIESWSWTFGDSDGSSLQNPIHTYSDTGTYAVRLFIENEFGCRDSLIQNVVIYPVYDIVIPNAFTPTSNSNGFYDPLDTSNDIFYPFTEYVEEFRMSIFNRWGELIFESLDINRGWNGFYRDEPCPQDVYVYKMEFKFSDGEKITRVGDITLFK